MGRPWVGVLAVSCLLIPTQAEAQAPLVAAAWTVQLDQAEARYLSVATAGDVNGDGFADIILGASNYSNGQTGEGRVFVHHGSASGLAHSPTWSAEGNQANAAFGLSVASAGDVNGDGFADVIIGAPGHKRWKGRADVYLGSATGLGSSAWSVIGTQDFASMGNAVASAGDVNGDGFSDVVVGTPFYTNGLKQQGRASLFLGSTSGLAVAPAWMAEGDQASAWFGHSVASAGDVNRDGFADVIVGSPFYANGQVLEGRAFLYLGGPSGLAATPVWTAEGDQTNQSFGHSVASAGDVNGDGFDDVVVGVSSMGVLGRVFLYVGGASGLAQAPAWTATESLPLGEREFGLSVASAGDVNGDGFPDVVFSAPLATQVYLGSSSGLGPTADFRLGSGAAPAVLGPSVASAGDVNGDGFADVLVSGGGSVTAYLGSASGFDLCAGVTCAPLDACHRVGTCNPITGACSAPKAPEGAECDDGSLCTQLDTCQNGTCVGASPLVCAPPGACQLAAACDPGEGCVYQPRPAGTACSDAACNGTVALPASSCDGVTAGCPVTAIDCASRVARNECEASGTCDPATGACLNPLEPEGTPCSAGGHCSGRACVLACGDGPTLGEPTAWPGSPLAVDGGRHVFLRTRQIGRILDDGTLAQDALIPVKLPALFGNGASLPRFTGVVAVRAGFVVITNSIDSRDNHVFSFVRVTDSGEVLDPTPITVSLQSYLRQADCLPVDRDLAVAGDGDSVIAVAQGLERLQFALVRFSDGFSTGGDLGSCTVNCHIGCVHNGTIPDECGLSSCEPAVAFDGSNYLVSWARHSVTTMEGNSTLSVDAALVAPDGQFALLPQLYWEESTEPSEYQRWVDYLPLVAGNGDGALLEVGGLARFYDRSTPGLTNNLVRTLSFPAQIKPTAALHDGYRYVLLEHPTPSHPNEVSVHWLDGAKGELCESVFVPASGVAATRVEDGLLELVLSTPEGTRVQPMSPRRITSCELCAAGGADGGPGPDTDGGVPESGAGGLTGAGGAAGQLVDAGAGGASPEGGSSPPVDSGSDGSGAAGAAAGASGGAGAGPDARNPIADAGDDASTGSPNDDAGSTGSPNDDAGCGCELGRGTSAPNGLPWALLALIGAARARSRNRARRP